jgi:hypothetical protein
MMGVRTPETRWTVHKRQVINLREIVAPSWLIYLNCMMMHGLANLKISLEHYYINFLAYINVWSS